MLNKQNQSFVSINLFLVIFQDTVTLIKVLNCLLNYIIMLK